MDTLTTVTIPTGYALVIEPSHLGEDGSLRIECRRTHGMGELEQFGEVAYWHTDGTNDIMQGETGTLVEVLQALVDFTAK